MKIKKDEGLTFDIKNEGLTPTKEDSKTYYTDVYEPGQTKGRLKIGREVEKETEEPIVPIVTHISTTRIFSRLASVGTGIQAFTGFGFTPTSYTISSNTDNGSVCQGAYDGTTQRGLYITNYAGFETGDAGRVIHLRDLAAAKGYAIHSSFVSDGIELEFEDSDIDCTLIITAHS